jgi:ribose transport system ATP-binding protein
MEYAAADPVQETTPALAIDARGLRKVFGRTTALAGVNFEVRAGEIHGLLGENGAGKSTLVKIMAGVQASDGGTLQFFGEDIANDPAGRRKAGLAFIHQDLGLFDEFSVADNIALACGFRRRGRFIDERETIAFAERALERIGFSLDVRKLVGELPLADQTIVAVCRALAEGARLIVLDEPTAYLEARQVRNLFGLLSRLRDEGVACVLITHRSEDVLRVCDRVTVLRDGRDIARRDASQLSEAELVRLITGREHDGGPAAVDKPDLRDSENVLAVDGLRAQGFGTVSFSVHQGEILGLCGLADAGQFAVGRAIIGDLPQRQGTLRLDGKPLRVRSINDALDVGIGFVPSDRARDGLAGTLTVSENIFMNPRRSWWKPLRRRREESETKRLMQLFRVWPISPEREVATFSGGNQQKVLLAKWLGGRRLALLNEPSAGVDVGAKADIHDEIRRECRTNGTAALLITTDFQEIVDLCDRALVMRQGVIVGELRADQLDADLLTELAYGGTV